MTWNVERPYKPRATAVDCSEGQAWRAITVGMPAATFAAIDAEAKRLNLARSVLLRRVITGVYKDLYFED
jgi:hypothetical protein